MELEQARALIKEKMPGHGVFVSRSIMAERYYRNKNDILFPKPEETRSKEEEPIRNADNRISHGFHGLLVKQKASYAFTRPPVFDVGTDAGNKKVTAVLGDKFAKNCKKICTNASNSGIAWVHYWKDENNNFKYAVVDSKQIIPIYTDDLEEELKAVLRAYTKVLDDGNIYDVYEIWTESECAYYMKRVVEDYSYIREYQCMAIWDIYEGATQATNSFTHDFERVPFIPFSNNDTSTSDLESIKGLIDSYDKVYSGFVNDLEDIQEVIFILSGYEGEDLGEFLTNLKQYKTVKLDADENNSLQTLSIQIPIEAREKLLEITRKEIFEQGQGVDPQKEDFGNQSGVALKFLYSLLELKVGCMESEFRGSFSELVRAICKYNNIACDNIVQTWTRTSVANDSEIVDMCQKSQGIVSNDTILRNHPFVTNVEEEKEQLEEEEEDAYRSGDIPIQQEKQREQEQEDGDNVDETE